MSPLVPVLLPALCLCLAAGLLVFAVAVPPAQAAPTGDVTGTVTNTDLAGIPNIDVFAIDAGGNYVNGVGTESDGSYDLSGLAPGTYRIEFCDYERRFYRTQYYDNEPRLEAADGVTVSAGETTPDIDATLVLDGSIFGKVTGADLTGLEGIEVSAWRSDGSGGWVSVMNVDTESDGTYDLGELAAGTYRVGFFEPWEYPLSYLAQYYNDKTSLAAADDITVTADSTTVGIDATLAAAGHITGTVHAGPSYLGDMYVTAWRSDGSGGWRGVNRVQTDGDGSYDIGGLTTGTYRVAFDHDPLDGPKIFLTQYYDNRQSFDAADDIAVTAGSTTSGIDATMAAGGHITGTVTDSGLTGLAGILVAADRSDGSGGWATIAEARTTTSGSYDLSALSTGTYRVQFDDLSWNYAAQYYNDKTSWDAADGIAVTAGSTTPGIDAVMTTRGSDTTAPTTVASGVDACWHRSAVTVTLAATDEAGGSGLLLTEYRRQGAALWSIYTAPFVVSAQGASTYQYRSIDVAQNAELAKTFTVRIDGKTPAATVKALSVRAAGARKGKLLRIKVTIDDPAPSCGCARLVVMLTTAKDRRFATMTFAREPTNKPLTFFGRLSHTLPVGNYYVSVKATDTAGNVQATAAKAKLTIK
jgi:5-hydroxyisourate hydrolase-like protein (transthyretin family)